MRAKNLSLFPSALPYEGPCFLASLNTGNWLFSSVRGISSRSVKPEVSKVRLQICSWEVEGLVVNGDRGIR